MSNFVTTPPQLQQALLSFPAPHVLLVTLNRPRDLNCINAQGHVDLNAAWEWMDAEPSLRVGIITGTGRAFCAGADLKGERISSHPKPKPHIKWIWSKDIRSLYLEWNKVSSTNTHVAMPNAGFGGLARRKGLKPVICAVNGICLGGGTEMIVNSDLVLASSRATFGLPEVKRGVVALAGALPRLVRTVGKQRALEMALTGRTLGAEEARGWGLVNDVVVVGDGVSEEDVCKAVVARALEVAGVITGNSPDAVIVSREGIKLGWEGIGADEAGVMLNDVWLSRLNRGENMKEGLKAFVEKRKPVWRDSKL
ncbi:Crotonase core [Penicillium taxi]|uniref:Crotonase core n=1 Tax=Penicillium taxi TaxID=168475 RepID=UPI0025458856|nr:Crotonase core [Penicillium taxi]KAJ5907553.1 Crotonase core [Penicillium taxi]